MSRSDRGWELYQQGAVEVDFISEDHMAFNVASSTRREIHKVDIMDDAVNCSCEDFQNRNKRESTKQLICMHLYAAFFKLAEINGLHELEQVQEEKGQLTRCSKCGRPLCWQEYKGKLKSICICEQVEGSE